MKKLMIHSVIALGLMGIGCWMDKASAQSLPEAADPEIQTPETQRPDGKLKDLDFFSREWSCNPSPRDASVEKTYKWEMTEALNGFWFVGRAIDANGLEFRLDTLGYNTVMEKFGRTVLGNDGTFTNLLSPGWMQDEMVWMGTSVNMATRVSAKQKVVVQKISDQSFDSSVYQAGERPDQWIKLSQETCTVLEPEG